MAGQRTSRRSFLKSSALAGGGLMLNFSCGALANALYKASGKRFYEQPFISQLNNVRGA